MAGPTSKPRFTAQMLAGVDVLRLLTAWWRSVVVPQARIHMRTLTDAERTTKDSNQPESGYVDWSLA